MVAKMVIGKEPFIIFNGTTRHGEAVVVLVCFVKYWQVKVRLVHFQIVRNSISGNEVARISIEVLHQTLDVLQSIVSRNERNICSDEKSLRSLSKHVGCWVYILFLVPRRRQM